MYQAGAATKDIASDLSGKTVPGNFQWLAAAQVAAKKIATFLSQNPNSALVN